MVRPARRFPHRDPRPDEGAAGQECGDRSDRRQGRLLSQAASADLRSRRLARRRDRELSDLHPLLAVDHRQYRREQDRPSRRCRRPRRRRSLFRRRRRQGHRDLLRRRQRDRDSSAASGSATPSPAAEARATTTRRWGSPPAAPGSRSSATSARWASTSRREPIRVAGVGDMSGDVFGNGMLLSKAIKLVAAFDHRHIFLDPDPDPATSWEERNRLFALPRSSWDDYDTQADLEGRRHLPAQPEVDPAVARDPRPARPRGGGNRSGHADHRDPQGAGRPALVRRHRHLHQGARARAMPRSAIRATTRSGSTAPSSAPRRSAKAPISPSPRPAGSSSRRPAAASTPTSSTTAPASIARTMRSTSRSRSTARWRKAG